MKWHTTQIAAVVIIMAGALLGTAAAIMPSPAAPVSPMSSVVMEQQEIVNTEQKAATPLVDQVRIHTVIVDDTLSAIAAKYQVDVDTILSANPDAGEVIHAGDQLIVLPQRGQLHVVETGDTFWGLSSQYGVAVDVIMKANSKPDERLVADEKIFVPGGRPRAVSKASRGVGVSRFIWPAVGELTSPYGYRWGNLHAGIDIGNDIGTTVRAARGGLIVFAGWQGGYGYTVIIDHGNDHSTLYGHLNGFAISPGQYVQAGQFIAYMGDTGNSTGPHLHFEVRVNGKPVNPAGYLN